jgi:transposase
VTALDKYKDYSRQELLLTVVELTQRLEQLERMVFGRRHERFIPEDPGQLSLGLAEVPTQPAPAVMRTIAYTRKSKTEDKPAHPGRMALPASLPREEVILEPEVDVSQGRKIGEEITEELDYTPGRLFVRRYVRPRYAIADRIFIAELPGRPLPKAIAGPGLLSQVVIDKYVDHLPVYRQAKRFEREGVRLPVSTLTDWVSGSCGLLEPLYEVHRHLVLTSGYLQADETPIRVLDRDKKGDTHRGYHWVYHAPLEGQVLFDYREGRGREGPDDCLKGFSGYLQTDGYVVYDPYAQKPGITLLHCMAHARRQFEQALDSDKARASYAMTEIQKLYAIEAQARKQGLAAAERYELRQRESVPLLAALGKWMEQTYQTVLPKSPLGKAIAYCLPRWERLSFYTRDGILEIDNNLVENAIRPVALGRKNYLFAGSHQGARRAAMLYSFLGTCKLHQVNPFEWLTATLTKLPDYNLQQIGELLPHRFKSETSS